MGVEDVDDGEAIDNALLVGTACIEKALSVCELRDLPPLPLESPFASERAPRRTGSGADCCGPKGSPAARPFTECAMLLSME